ncbi:structure-specific endonuclease subunit SLX4 [Clathrospora elynae]|uniref:Structure-specific endonuclease subunit SLX4 n=1 Tax=Clathrospora elynae TaxID=706981 RepID=A0A6A5SJ20_9PLEO|nr:structure-specific endonuclease subunit SLX4 [Clathrospora elynae]
MRPSSPLDFSPPVSPKRTTTGASKANIRADPIPDGAARGFATVGRLIRSDHFTSRLDDDFAEIQQVQSRHGSLESTGETAAAPKKPPKRTAKKVAADGVEKPKPKPRVRNTKTDKAVGAPDTDDAKLRPPPPTKSPFFDHETPEPPAGPPKEVAPKLTKSGKPRKPRVKKQKVEEDGSEPVAKPKKTRVTKPKAAVKDGKGQRQDASLVSAHFCDNTDRGEGSAVDRQGTLKSVETRNADIEVASIWELPQSPRPKKRAASKQQPPEPIAEGLHLEEAVMRRRDWTPPHDTAFHSPSTQSTGKENKQLAQNADGTFTHMLSNFTFAQLPSAQITAKPTSAHTGVMAATKRRRVELVEIPSNQVNSRESSPEKDKAPKKKPRTITDLVTGQYAPRDAESDPNAATSNFFEPCPTVIKVPLNDTSAPNAEAATKKPPRKRASKSASEKAEPKARSKKASTKSAAKPKRVAEKLLSPASALLRMNRQDVLFGTSSQLALEESPTMVRQLQLAIRKSEQDADSLNSFSIAPPPRWPKLKKSEGKRGLWAVSARDDEGGMLEHMEDVYIPEPDRTQDFPLLMDGTNDEPEAEPSFAEIDDLEPPRPAVVISSDLPTPLRPTPQASRTVHLASTDYHMNDLLFDDIDDFQEPPPSNQNAESQNSFVDIDLFDSPPSAQMRRSPAPKFKPPPPAIKADGSPKKRRDRPPKPHAAIPTVAASSTPVLTPSAPEAKEMAKDKKQESTPKGSGRFIDIDEILDSEDETLETLSPTPPRVRKFQDVAPLPPIALSPTTSPAKKSKKPVKDKPSVDANLISIHRILTANLEWSTIKPTVFAAITAHIRALPPTTDPKKPSWHEKMLMYDPIVLEDFTFYLNTHTPIRTYKKATQRQTKAWNAKLKANGEPVLNVEKEGQNVLAIEKELEGYMAREWCESLSVCCIWSEGRGKGGARKAFY